MANDKYPKITAAADKVSLGRLTVVRFIANTPFWCGTTLKHRNQFMIENMTDMPEITYSANNEREFFNTGFVKSVVNDGGTWSGSMQFEGATVAEVLAMIGKRPTTAGAEYGSLPHGGTASKVGHLVFDLYDQSNSHIGCHMLMDIDLKFYQLPGGTDGENSYMVEFSGVDSTAVRLIPGKTIAAEFWMTKTVESTADANAEIDGANLDFALGTGNRSFASATTPTAAKIDTAKYTTTLSNFFYGLRRNGSTLSDSEVTFTFATGLLTFGTAPAATDTITAIYATSTTTVPHTDGGSNYVTQRASTLMGV